MITLPIVLTDGPGGGKTSLINELIGDPAWRKRLVVNGALSDRMNF